MTNLVILVGRIARDPETRTTQGGTSITSISVVTDRPARKDGKTYKDENGYTAKDSEFHRITCFNGVGKTVEQSRVTCDDFVKDAVGFRQRVLAVESLAQNVDDDLVA